MSDCQMAIFHDFSASRILALPVPPQHSPRTGDGARKSRCTSLLGLFEVRLRQANVAGWEILNGGSNDSNGQIVEVNGVIS